MKNNTIDPEWDAPYFIGVKTLNIYCFPWCKGQPKPENTTKFESRAEAEQAGYRSYRNCCSGLPQGSWEDNKQELTLFVPKEFRFAENLNYLSRSANGFALRLRNM